MVGFARSRTVQRNRSPPDFRANQGSVKPSRAYNIRMSPAQIEDGVDGPDGHDELSEEHQHVGEEDAGNRHAAEHVQSRNALAGWEGRGVSAVKAGRHVTQAAKSVDRLRDPSAQRYPAQPGAFGSLLLDSA